LTVSLYSTFLLAGFFFLMGAAVMGIVWYLQSVAGGGSRKSKQAHQDDTNLAEVACLMRDKTTQDLVVTINGNVYHQAPDLNPGQLRRLHFASQVLVKWLAETPPPPLSEDAEAPIQVDAAALEPAETTPPSTEAEWIPAESAPEANKLDFTPPFVVAPSPEVKPVSTQISDVVGNILKPAAAQAAQPEYKSIAMQIDEILQEMIANTPFAARGISVNDAPDHGVMVTLDGENYPGVKDVPDEEVRNLIRSAVVEWEKTGKFSSR
jgi:hypothetical protein